MLVTPISSTSRTADIQAMLKTARFRASSDFSEIAIADIITICVPTPLNRYREPDLSYVTSTAAVIARQCATRSA